MRFNNSKILIAKQIAIELTIKSLKDEVKDIAVKHFTKSFDLEGFNDLPVKNWKPLKRQRAEPYRSNKILTKTGALKKSLKSRAYVGKRIWWVEIYSNLAYANVHNEGLRSGRGRGFKMPKRQFMGESKSLDRKIQTRINNRLNQAFK